MCAERPLCAPGRVVRERREDSAMSALLDERLRRARTRLG